MKAVILAGGLGTRLSEETAVRPKPMVEVGGMPILWHIMKMYHSYGISDFVICCGYKGNVIKEYFANYTFHRSDVVFDVGAGKMSILNNGAEHWTVTLVDTGSKSMTGGRLRRVREHLGDETFCMTYGDGVSSVDIRRSIEFHREHGKLATMTAVQPSGRFGAFTLEDGEASVRHFREKPKGDMAWVNGGFFILEPEVVDFIEGDHTTWEQEPLERLAHSGELVAYRHEGFWQPMDTLRDRNLLEELWASDDVPWRSW